METTSRLPSDDGTKGAKTRTIGPERVSARDETRREASELAAGTNHQDSRCSLQSRFAITERLGARKIPAMQEALDWIHAVTGQRVTGIRRLMGGLTSDVRAVNLKSGETLELRR